MDTRELIAHLTEIIRAYDEGTSFAVLSDAERRILEQKIIGAAALDGLAAELERAKPRREFYKLQ